VQHQTCREDWVQATASVRARLDNLPNTTVPHCFYSATRSLCFYR